MQNKHLLLTVIFFASGLVFIGLAGWFYLREYNLERSGYSAQGIVVDMVESIDDDGSSYAPIVRFRAHSGHTLEFQSGYYTYPAAYEIGQTVTVLYPADNPSKAILKGESNLLILIFGILGVVCCFAFGIAAWVMGNGDLSEMDAGRMDATGRGLTVAGKIIGIVSVAWAVLQLIGLIIWVALMAAGTLPEL